MTPPIATVTATDGPERSRPSRARFALLGMLCLLTGILYLDRVCIAQALGPIRRELGLSNTQMSFVLTAFMLAYGLFEVPTGRWGDRYGARRILTRIAVWWSVFTMLTGACWDLGSLVVVRFLFGAGEAGALPNAARVIARWYPAAERGRVQGFLTFSALLGGTTSPVVASYLIESAGWRPTFAVFGVTGVVWAVAFHAWFRDDPAEHPGVNQAERALIEGPGAAASTTHEPIPWRAVARTPTIWLLGLSMTCSSFNSYLYFSWFPSYLQSARGVAQVESGWLAGGVLAGGACGMLLGGFLVDCVCGRGPRGVARRRAVAVLSYLAASALLFVAVSAGPARATAAAAAGSCLAAATVNSLWWASATEVSGRHIGSLFGLMNSMGIFGGMASQLFFGAFTDWRGRAGFVGRAQWDPAFYLDMVVLLFGAACWIGIDPTRSVDDPARAPETSLDSSRLPRPPDGDRGLPGASDHRVATGKALPNNSAGPTNKEAGPPT